MSWLEFVDLDLVFKDGLLLRMLEVVEDLFSLKAYSSLKKIHALDYWNHACELYHGLLTNTYSAIGKFSRRQIDIFLFFPRK